MWLDYVCFYKLHFIYLQALDQPLNIQHMLDMTKVYNPESNEINLF